MERTFWQGRFRVTDMGGVMRFDDRLRRTPRYRSIESFRGLEATQLDTELLRCGFADAVMEPVFLTVADAPRHADDTLFWQFPCRTEASAWAAHAGGGDAPFDGEDVHVYMGLPWATWLDRRRVDQTMQRPMQEVAMQRVRLSGLRGALEEAGAGLRVHTVCQHVYWRDFLPLWRNLGVTDLWLSHLPQDGEVSGAEGLRLHPWRLFAVNVEDERRSRGLRLGCDPAQKPLLASFIGAHADHYVTDVRRRLESLAGEPGFLVEVTDRWHFESVVYDHQVHGMPLADAYGIDDTVERYNRVLSDSVFSLCPAGAGPNTLRLWESLAVGSVPVLLGPAPALPRGGTLEAIDWDAILLRVPEACLDELPERLRSMPLEEVRCRQKLAMNAFERVRKQRCFGTNPATLPAGIAAQC